MGHPSVSLLQLTDTTTAPLLPHSLLVAVQSGFPRSTAWLSIFLTSKDHLSAVQPLAHTSPDRIQSEDQKLSPEGKGAHLCQYLVYFSHYHLIKSPFIITFLKSFILLKNHNHVREELVKKWAVLLTLITFSTLQVFEIVVKAYETNFKSLFDL
jgi:hypothetical protein